MLQPVSQCGWLTGCTVSGSHPEWAQRLSSLPLNTEVTCDQASPSSSPTWRTHFYPLLSRVSIPDFVKVSPIWGKFVTTDVLGRTVSFLQLAGLWLRIILRRISSGILFFFFAVSCLRVQEATDQLKPKPAPLGLCVARMGSVIPLPSGPSPIPGLQPMLCNMRLPMFVSGIGAAFSPTTPEKKMF